MTAAACKANYLAMLDTHGEASTAFGRRLRARLTSD